eukprot:403361169
MQDQLSYNMHHEWIEKDQDILLLQNLIKSRSNIFVYGAHGSGKTTFVKDCLDSLEQSSSSLSAQSQQHIYHIYIDCIEYYSEKLIATMISFQLNQILQKFAISNQLTKTQARKYQVRSCRNFPMLMDAMQGFCSYYDNEKNSSDSILKSEFFFYIVLDNIQNLLEIERTKKLLTKLCVIQSLLTPQCFSLLVINHCLVQEIEVLKDQQGIFEEYMFTCFFFLPMVENQIHSILLEKLRVKFGTQPYLEIAFEKMFNQLFSDIKSYTRNINEYEYYFTFLYPSYIEPLKNLTDKEIDARLQKPLSNKNFLGQEREVKSALFMHYQSMDDVKKNLEMQIDQEFQEKIKEQNKAQRFQNQEILKQKTFEVLVINQLENSKKNMNFTYMQSLCLIAAYLAGANKECIDQRMFQNRSISTRSKKGLTNVKSDQQKQPGQGQFMLGKTKKFYFERYAGIIDYLVSLVAEESKENYCIGRSLDYIACINSMCEEGLIKKSTMKKGASGGGDGGDELVNVGFKCNFDFNFIEDVCKKIDFRLDEYLFNPTNDES